jgi:Winged helix DNA-binding domain
MICGVTRSVTWQQVLGRRLRWQLVDEPSAPDAVTVVERLAGVQAQVPSAAELAVAVRRREPAPGALAQALARGELVRTWAHRGTLHVLPVAAAGAHLALLAAARSWHRSPWQRTFAPLAVMDALAEQIPQALAGGPLTRAELVEALRDHAGDVAGELASGWGTVLKPLAWQGLLCQGPPRGRNVTFARPDLLLPGWRGLPAVEEAAPVVVRAYLAAYGPATPDAFDAWLLRGASRRADLTRWFAGLADELTEVDVEGRRGYLLTEHLDDLLGGPPVTRRVHLLPAFDQYVLGPGTADPQIVPAEQRKLVSRAGGWISPVVLVDGRVAGTWEVADGAPVVTPFPGVTIPARPLAEAVERLGAALPAATESMPS